MTNIIRTPDERFEALPGYDFSPHYRDLPDPDFGSLRMHYLDEGPRDGKVILLLHGQGCWSYIFRDMIPQFAAAGYRVIAPDFIGFGRSDKLPSTDDYTFERHVEWLTNFFRAMEFNGVNAYLFDWGGYFGLRIAAEYPHMFDRIALSNTQLPTGDSPGKDWFIKWRAEQFALPRFPQGEMVNDGCRKNLDAETISAYDAPYVDESYKAGPRRCPMILPISPDMKSVPENRAAWQVLSGWTKPMLTLFSADFKGTAMGPEKLLAHIPGTRGQAHELLEDAGFYLIEDKPDKLVRGLTGFFNG